ncbi:MAG: TolC family protein [Phycisphaerales bacterium JB063]
MSPTRYAHYLALPGLVACSTLLAGCLSPEAHSVFTPDWDQHLRAADADHPDLPQSPSLRSAHPEDWVADKLETAGPIELSVEEAVVMALRNNRDLQVQQLSPVITGTFEQIERGVFDPELFAELAFGQSTASEIDRGTGQQFSVDDSEAQAIAGVRQQLPSGTDVELSIGQNRDTSNRAPEQQDARIGLTVTQQLLRGAGPAVNLARLEQAKLDTAASRYVLRGFAEALLAQVETTYWQYVLAAERIAIFERSRDVALTQLDVIEKRVAVGALARTELAAARAELARREQALIDARSDLEAQRLRLLRLIDANPEGELTREVRVTSRPQLEPEPLNDLREHLQLARGSRNDLAEARLRLEQDRLETIVTRNGVLPRLEVFAALGKTGYADTFGNSFSELDSDTYDLSAGVRLSHLLGNDAAQARNQAAYASRRQSAAAISNLEQLVELDVRLAANELERARQQITASATTRSLQEETVRAEEERFEVGASTTLLVAQAQRDLLETQIAEVEAIVAYRLALIDLYLAEGSLLDRRGFVLE